MHKKLEDLLRTGASDPSIELECNIFESLRNAEADVTRQFLIAILSDENHGVLGLTQPGSLQHTAISNVIALLNHNCQDKQLWLNAGDAAWKAAWADAVAARVVTWVVRAAAEAAAWVAWAVGAARTAEGAAWAVTDAVQAAAWADAWAAQKSAEIGEAEIGEDEVRAAARSTEVAHYQWIAHTLSNLLNQAPLLPPKEPQHA